MKTPISFHAATDIVVTGSNPENADMVNPYGHYYGAAAYVVAEDADGNRVRMHICTHQIDREALDKAQVVADALNARLERLGRLPVGFPVGWDETFPAYGSDAYSSDDALEWERRQEGPHYYGSMIGY